MNKSVWFLSLILIALMAFSMIFINYDIINHPLKNTSSVDSFMINAKYQKFNALGQIHFTLSSEHMTHYRLHDTAYFTHPHLFGYTAERIPWQVDALQGKTIQGTNQIYFWNNVILKQLPYLRHPTTTTIQTSAMTVFPSQSLGITNQPVMILRPNSVAHGLGMRADFKSGLIELLSQARGSYDPKQD